MEFKYPVSDVLYGKDNIIYVLSESPQGEIYILDKDFKVIRIFTTGASYPSDMCFSEKNNTFWVTDRFRNRILQLNKEMNKMLGAVNVGREPISISAINNGEKIIVANNLPLMRADKYPVCARIDIIDALTATVDKIIDLPNGSTDIKDMAVSPDGKNAYITHLLSRYQLPTNQLDRGWMVTNAISVLNLDSLSLINTILLDTPQKGAPNPKGINISDNGQFIYIAISGSNEIAIINREQLNNRLDSIYNNIQVVPSSDKFSDIVNDAGFLYGIRNFYQSGGRGPRDVISFGDKLYVANYFSGTVAVINLDSNETKNLTLGKPITITKEGEGEYYFHSAEYAYQNWQSCATCHPNDARTDGLNWDLLNDGMGNPKNTKSLLYSHKTAPCMITGIRKDAYAAVRSGIKYILFANVDENIANCIDAYLLSLNALQSPYLKEGKLSHKAEKGKIIFDKSCIECHKGEFYTDGKLYDINWSIGHDKNIKMDVPTLREVWRTAPYLYDGRSLTIKEMLNIHGTPFEISNEQAEELEEYVLSL
ncbi:MAG: YncE family protein [Bacteroidales bacterium]|nr:YncE family protein [Bacteroidales bacterium]